MAAAVMIGGVLLLGMMAAAGYAAAVLPAGARVPLNAGVPEYSVWLPKPAGLAAWLAVGAVTFAALTAVTLSGLADGWAVSMRVVLLPCAMTVVFAAEAGAVISARQRCADGLPPAAVPDTPPAAAPYAPSAAEPEASTAAEPEASTAAEPEASTAAEPEASTAAEPGAGQEGQERR